jgi:hypothetical protein
MWACNAYLEKRGGNYEDLEIEKLRRRGTVPDGAHTTWLRLKS